MSMRLSRTTPPATTALAAAAMLFIAAAPARSREEDASKAPAYRPLHVYGRDRWGTTGFRWGHGSDP